MEWQSERTIFLSCVKRNNLKLTLIGVMRRNMNWLMVYGDLFRQLVQYKVGNISFVYISPILRFASLLRAVNGLLR